MRYITEGCGAPKRAGPVAIAAFATIVNPALCVHSVHIFLLNKSTTDETQTPKQFPENYCIWSPPCRSVK